MSSRCPRPRVPVLLGLVALVLAPAATRSAHAQQVPEQAAVQAEVEAAQDALARGIAEFDGPQQSRSIVVFDTVITRLEAVGSRSLPVQGKDVLASAYEYRGRAYYGIGLAEKTAENFRQLIQLKPDYALSKERVSPKIVELFDSLKRTLVGRLAVSSDPPGAQVTLVSGATGQRTDLPLTDFFPIEVLAGEYTLEVARAGYRTDTLAVSITAEATETRAVPLTRVLASGVAGGRARGRRGLGRRRAAHDHGGQPGARVPRGGARARARPEPRGPAGGAREPARSAATRSSCAAAATRARSARSSTPLAEDYVIEPIKLEDSLGSLKLTSDPPGARILVNGEARGVTPARGRPGSARARCSSRSSTRPASTSRSWCSRRTSR